MRTDEWIVELHEKHYETLYKLVANRLRMYVGHDADAQDILQDVFMEAARKEICDHPNPVGWLMITSVNMCKNYVRSHQRNERKKQKCLQEMERQSRWEPTRGTGIGFDETGISDIWVSLEQTLTEEELRLIKEYCLLERPLKEIGKEQHITTNVLRVRIFRIRKKLKHLWE